MQLSFIALVVAGAVALAFVLYWIIRAYMGSSQNLPGSYTDALALTEPDAKEGQSVRSYALQISPKRVAARPPSFEGTAYSLCGTQQQQPRLVDAKYSRTMWLPLVPSRHSLALHDDISNGRVKHLIIGGTIVLAWAVPPRSDASNTVLLAVSDPNLATVAKCPRIAPILQPFTSAPDSHARLGRIIRGDKTRMLNAWAF